MLQCIAKPFGIIAPVCQHPLRLGEIIEQGSHDDLVARDGAYAELWSAFATPAAETSSA